MLVDAPPTAASSVAARHWRYWLAGIVLFLSPLFLWAQAREGSSAAWTISASDLPAATHATFSSERGLISLYRWSSAGLSRSVDGGLTWAALGEGLPTSVVGSLLLSTIRPGPGRTLYALAGPPDRRGLYRSQDGGASFSLVYQPLSFSPDLIDVGAGATAELIALAANEILTVSGDGGITWREATAPGSVQTLVARERVWAAGEGWLLISEGGGGAWRLPVAIPDGIPRLAVAPQRGPAQLYLLYDDGVWRTLDEGATWQPLALPGAVPVTALAFDPLVWQTLYLGDARGRLWRSDDWGEHWRSLPSPHNGPIRALFQPPGSRERLFAASGFDFWWIDQQPLHPTSTHTPTSTATATATSSPTATSTATATTAPTATATTTSAASPTPLPTATPTPLPTATPALPSASATPTPSPSLPSTPPATPQAPTPPPRAATPTPLPTLTPAPPTPIPTATSYR